VNVATPLTAVTELVPTTVAPLETVIVTVAALEASLLPALSVIQTTGWVPNATPLDAGAGDCCGDSPAAGWLMTSFVAVVPVPVNAMGGKLLGTPLVVAEMTKLPERLPPAVGVKTTLTVQELFFGNVWGQLFV
jgi:hypothetical protein